MLRVIAQTDIARMQHALMAYRRDHEHEHSARHHPMRDRFLAALQGPPTQASRTGFRMKNARRYPDAQRALSDALTSTVEYPAGTCPDHATEHRPCRITRMQVSRRGLPAVLSTRWNGWRQMRCAKIRRRGEIGREAFSHGRGCGVLGALRLLRVLLLSR